MALEGRTENALLGCGFRKVHNFRPGFMQPSPGQRNTKSYYKVIGWLYPLLHALLPDQVSTLRQVGLAMINCVLHGSVKTVLEIKDINALAQDPAPQAG